MKDLYVQVDLKSNDGSMMTTWLKDHPSLVEGDQIRLDKETEWRTIQTVYSNIKLTKDQLDLNRNWDNNI